MTTQAPIPLGRFQLFKLLKKGGMARVFLAVDPAAPDEVLAIKTLLPELAGKRSYREMFQSEAEVGLHLRHPGIARTVEHGEDRKTPWIAMEYVFGLDLSSVLRRLRQKGRVMPPGLAVATALDVARALAYAHALTDDAGQPLDIVNRDVSPGNIMVAFDGTVKLIDFGIAQTTIDVKSQIGAIKGKISYMAPEQVRGLPVDHRVDVFSLGTVLYEMLTGVQVFRDEGDFATMEKVRRAEAPPPSTHTPAVDALLDGIVARALAREASDRYPSADAMAASLKTWLDRHGGEAERVAERQVFMATLFAGQQATMEADIAAAMTGVMADFEAEDSKGPARFISEAALDDLLAAEGRPDEGPQPGDGRPRSVGLLLGVVAAVVAAALGAWLALRG
ncbi:MAG: serine/threonine protein kinase [Myxococcales bacterium]|nr:serine/threonine protein kinase [Myxococcales bacterium]